MKKVATITTVNIKQRVFMSTYDASGIPSLQGDQLEYMDLDIAGWINLAMQYNLEYNDIPIKHQSQELELAMKLS